MDVDNQIIVENEQDSKNAFGDLAKISIEMRNKEIQSKSRLFSNKVVSLVN